MNSSNKYDDILQLINHWNAFEQTGKEISMGNFGQWLIEDEGRQNDVQDEIVNESRSKNGKHISPADIDDRQIFLNSISRLVRILEFYTKKFFEGLPLSNLLELNFLSFINKNLHTNKKEVIENHLVEYTTGIDIIKRLIRLGLLTESQDELDKRSKRLKITAEGKKVLIESLLILNKIDILVFDSLPGINWKESLPVIKRLEQYHSDLYMNFSNGTGYDLLNYMQTKIKAEQ